MSTVFNLLTSPLGFPTTPVWSWLLSLIIGGLAHEIAWQISPGGRFGSIIYWATKLLSFVIVWALINGCIMLYRFVVANSSWFIVGGLVVLAIVIAWLLAHKFGSGENGKNER